jgi:hypothetical protein
MASWVLLVSVLAVTAAGIVHQRFGPRRSTTVVLVVVVIIGVAASVAAASLRAAACPCG